MSNCNDIADILRRNGLDQPGRYDAALDPANLELLGFGAEEWMKFARNLAEQVSYFGESSDTAPDGNWQDFFPGSAEMAGLIASLSENNRLTPHLALFLCFIYLLGDSQKKLNGFTKRHLDFYFSEVLQIPHLAEEPDKVSIIFGLAKNFAQQKIAAGAELEAGKDAEGKKLIYELGEELALGAATVADIRNVYNPVGSPVNGSYALRASQTANSFDGQGGVFAGSDVSWYPFGYAGTPGGRPLLPQARTGFALASGTLRLSEGRRQLAVQAVFKDVAAQAFAAQDIVSNLSVYYTGEKGWEGPYRINSGGFSMKEDNGAIRSYATGMADKTLTMYIDLQPDAKPSVPYSQTVHGGNYRTGEPIFRFEVSTESQAGYAIYSQLTRALSSVKLKLNVTGMHKAVIENDNGTLNAEKPFYAFTTNPVTGSSFTVFSEEIFAKKWKRVDVTMHWKNTPDSFPTHYQAYDTLFNGVVSRNWAVELADRTQQAYRTAGSAIRYNGIVSSDSYFKAYKSIFAAGDWRTPDMTPVTLFTGQSTELGHTDFFTRFGVDNANYRQGDAGPLRLSLKQSFLQELFPKIYALSLTSDNTNVSVPNQPYIPFADELVLDYTATDELSFASSSLADFDSRSVQLFHVHPFGEAEEHDFLKSSFFGTAKDCSLAPLYCKGGELYIGLENARQLQQVSLLVQVLEGSEDPLAESFNGKQKVHWHILCDNNWKELGPSLLVKNETDNFLRSGLIKLQIPAEATGDNTLLPPGRFWLRAKIHKSFDVVCRVLGIHAQAATAVFDNRENELSHLGKGVPAGTVSKLVNRLSFVRSVDQPYNSYGGRAAENDEQYYRRVSERLRHKHRAINLWDYEHIVLQEFPEIYKAKCLNHTCDCSYQSGGNVTLVVIPDTLNRNVFDRFQPRVSKATLNRIGERISQLNSLHVKTHVINPDYEEVRVSLKVKFYPQYDEALCIDRLNDDISGFLSPWAFDRSERIRFGESLYLSVLIDFAENLAYVDYLQDVKIYHKGRLVTIAEPSSPKSILVSAKKHEISTDVKSCSTTTNSATETCQL
jgi:hypothetical protein